MKNTGIRTDIHPDTGSKPMKLEPYIERGPIDALSDTSDRVDTQVDPKEDWRSFWKVAEDDETVDLSPLEDDSVEFKVPTATIYTQGVLRLSPEDQYRIQCDISKSMNFKNGRMFLENL